MPPRYAYWTIIVEGKPTAFRAHEQEELLPTLRQLQARHPDAVMKWFARGRLWDSREEERAAAKRPRPAGEHRGRGWRPGGRHEDPRDRFKIPRDEKRRRFAARLRHERDEGRGPTEGGRRGEQPPQENRPTPPPSGKRPWRPEGASGGGSFRRPEHRGGGFRRERRGPGDEGTFGGQHRERGGAGGFGEHKRGPGGAGGFGGHKRGPGGAGGFGGHKRGPGGAGGFGGHKRGPGGAGGFGGQRPRGGWRGPGGGGQNRGRGGGNRGGGGPR